MTIAIRVLGAGHSEDAPCPTAVVVRYSAFEASSELGQEELAFSARGLCTEAGDLVLRFLGGMGDSIRNPPIVSSDRLFTNPPGHLCSAGEAELDQDVLNVCLCGAP